MSCLLNFRFILNYFNLFWQKLVAGRFSEQKKIKGTGEVKADGATSVSLPVEQERSEIVATVINTKETEEIYLFDLLQSYRRTTYFMLLIGEGLGAETLGRMQ